MNRIASGCESKLDVFGRCFGQWPMSLRRSEGLHSFLMGDARRLCWLGLLRMKIVPFLLFSPTVRRGRVQLWRLRWGQASVRCRGRLIRSRPQERCSSLAAPELVVG